MSSRIAHGFSLLLGLLLAISAARAAEPAPLEFRMYSGVEASLFPNSVLVMGTHDAVLIDGQWWLSEGRKLADMIEGTGRSLKYILLTHAHPDHYMGLAPVVERFPGVRILARKLVRDEIQYGFPAKRMHWQEMVPDDMPMEPIVPEEFDGKSIDLEGHEIRFVDLPPAETLYATAYYVPSAKTLIAGDLIFSGSHSYMADVNNATAWIDALAIAKKVGPIDRVYPGHGPAGGAELIDAEIEYMKVYRDVAAPGVRVAEVAREMTERYPDYRGAILLWLTRGPGFGLSGAKELGVPPDLLGPAPAK